MNKKNKFIENNCDKLNKQPHYDQINNDNCIHNMMRDNYNSKNKSRFELVDNLDPYNYNLSYENKIKKDLKGEESFIYYSPYNQGPGRGFGNLNINNMIRKSESSRNDTEDFKLFRESEIIDRFDFLDNRFSNPNNLVFPFPRSGENTRKAAEKLVENSQNINNYHFNKPNKIKISNDYNIINQNNLPNQQLIDSINNTNNQQKQRQKMYKEQAFELQNKINQLKVKYGPNLTRQIIIKELNLKNDPKVDEFLQMELDNIESNNFNQMPINYSSEMPINYSSEMPVNYSSEMPNNNFNQMPINYSSEMPINYSSEMPVNYSSEMPVNYSSEMPNNNFNQMPVNYSSEMPNNNFNNTLEGSSLLPSNLYNYSL